MLNQYKFLIPYMTSALALNALLLVLIYLCSKLIIAEESQVCEGAHDVVPTPSFGGKSPLKVRLTKAGFVGFGKATELLDNIRTTSDIAGRFAASSCTHRDQYGCILMLAPAGNI